jgi:hypothetical protein
MRVALIELDRGKATLLLLIRRWQWTDASREFPACLKQNLEAELSQHLDWSALVPGGQVPS